MESLAGSLNTINEIVILYKSKLLKYFMYHVKDYEDAQDLLQETFINISRSIDKLKNTESINIWIYKIAHNLLISFYRKKKNKLLVYDQDFDDLNLDIKKVFTPEEHYIIEETENEVLKCVRELPDKYRIAFILKEIFDLNYTEIAEIMDIKFGTVQSRIFRAREILIKKLNRKGIKP